MNNTQDVISLLLDLEHVARRHRVNAWADEFNQVRLGGADNRQELKRLVLRMYEGTMGSLTDVMISRFNGHEVDDEVAANAELDRLIHELWERANAL